MRIRYRYDATSFDFTWASAGREQTKNGGHGTAGPGRIAADIAVIFGYVVEDIHAHHLVIFGEIWLDDSTGNADAIWGARSWKRMAARKTVRNSSPKVG